MRTTKSCTILFVSVVAICTLSLYILKPDQEISKTVTTKDLKMQPSSIAFYHAGWEFMKTKDPQTDQIPVNIKAKERKYVSGLPLKSDYNAKTGGVMPPVRYLEQEWTFLGPDNVAGRFLTLKSDIKNDDVILAGSASGGLWKSVNGGSTWIKITPANEVQSVTCLAQDTRTGKTETWYYGTGELTNTTDRKFSIFPRTLGFGDGIYKSEDNGDTWTHLPSTSGNTPGHLSSAFQGIWNIAVNPYDQNNDVVYVAGYGGILRSVDGGDSWSHVLGDPINKSYCTDIAIASNGIIYAALGTFSTNEQGLMSTVFGIWKSEDGINWASITPEGFPSQYRTINIEIAESNPNSLYVLTENPHQDPDPVLGFSNSIHTFWKASHLDTDNILWEDRTANIPGKGLGNIAIGAIDPPHGYNSIGGYAFTLKIHPQDEDFVFLGGTNLYGNTSGFSDSTFTKVYGGYPYDGDHANLHPDIHDVHVLPSSPASLFVATDGGIYNTMDCYADSTVWGWLSENMNTTQFYWVGIDHASSNDEFVVGGCQDNAVYYHDRYFPGQAWGTIMGGDGLTCIVADNKEYAVVSVYSGNIFSVTFNDDMDIENEIYQRPDIASDKDFSFFTTFSIDRVNNKTFYMAALNRILRKDDMAAAANDTSLVNIGWEWIENTGIMPDEVITSINTSVEPADIIYYGSNNGKMFRMENASTPNPVVTEITGCNFPTNGFIGYIEVDPTNANNIFVAFSNYNIQSLFHSDDAGATWTNISGNLEENQDGSGGGPSVRCIRMLNYEDGTGYFAATSAGLFSTYELNGDQTIWVQEGANIIGNTIIDHIDCRETDGWMVIATQGSGIYQTHFEPSGIDNNDIVTKFELQCPYPNPCKDKATVKFSIQEPSQIQLEIYDISGRKISSVEEGFYTRGEYQTEINTSDLQPGSYFLKLRAGDQQTNRKIIVM